jgi:hypothetical protein
MREWITEHAIMVYQALLPFFWITAAILKSRLRQLSGMAQDQRSGRVGLFIVSYIFGATTWFLGAAITFGSFGWLGLIIGVCVFGTGVVPLGIFGAFFALHINDLGISLCVMLLITLAARFTGAAFAASADRAQRPES